MKAQGPKSIVSPETAILSVFIHAMDETDVQPARDQPRLPLDHSLQQGEK